MKRALKATVVMAVTALVMGFTPALVWASWGQRMVLPVYGTVSQEFSGSHPGIDVAAQKGTNVYAVSDGVVIDTRTGSFQGDSGAYGAGNYVVIQHKPGDSNPYRGYCPLEEWTKYCHLYTISVRPGQIVKRGQLIGTVGNTGNVTGNHLHFEIRLNGRYGIASNPREWIRFGFSSITGKGDIW